METGRLHLDMLTLFHPWAFLGYPPSELSQLPCIRRNRKTLEARRRENATEKHHALTYEMFHGRPISNAGKTTDGLRLSWISGATIQAVAAEYDVRLIDTEETGTQARWRCEFRYDWAGEPGAWSEALKHRLLRGIGSAEKLSIRQLWRNPTKFKTGALPLAVPIESVEQVGNLIVGPFEPDSARETPFVVKKENGVWWITSPK